VAREEVRLLETVFWIFFGGVALWILGVWISMLIPRCGSRSAARRSAGSGGGFADTGVDSLSSSFASSDSGTSVESGGGGESGGGDFSGGGGESGGGGSSGSW
jgi:uncharacterized protein